MSEMNGQIIAKCAQIAKNQRAIYDKGVSDGKASVKIITFYIVTDWEEAFNALSTMTWREFVNSPFNTWDSLRIEDGKIRYGDYYYVDVELDDIIVEFGIYQATFAFSLSYNGKTYTLFCYQYQEWSSWVESDFNTMGLYFDENDALRMPTGEYIYAVAEGSFNVNKWNTIEWGAYKAITLCSCDIGFGTVTFESGMTWNDFVNSSYSNGTGVYVRWNEESYEDELHHWGGSESQYFYYNGNRVTIYDLMIDGATYEYR